MAFLDDILGTQNKTSTQAIVSSRQARDLTNRNLAFLSTSQPNVPEVPTAPVPTPTANAQTPVQQPNVFNIQSANSALQNIIKQTNELLKNPQVQSGLTPELRAQIGQIQGLDAQAQANAAQAQSAYNSGNVSDFNALVEQMKKSQEERDKTISTLQGGLQPLREKYLQSLLPTEAEKTIQSQLAEVRNRQSALDLSIRQGAEAQYGLGRPLAISTGRERELERQGEFKKQDLRNEETLLLNRLGIAQTDRQLEQTVLEKGLGFAMDDFNISQKLYDAQDAREQKIFDNAIKLDTQQRQQFADILDTLKGGNPDNLTPKDEAAISQVASARGISPAMVRESLQVQYDREQLDRRKKEADIQKQIREGTSTEITAENYDQALQEAVSLFETDRQNNVDKKVSPDLYVAIRNKIPASKRDDFDKWANTRGYLSEETIRTSTTLSETGISDEEIKNNLKALKEKDATKADVRAYLIAIGKDPLKFIGEGWFGSWSVK